jgi:hypothetical protein
MDNNSFSIKNIIVTLVFLCSISFFELRIIPSSLLQGIGFLGICIMVVFLIFHFIYDKTPRLKKHFAIEIYLVFISLILSMFGAYIFHGQDFKTTALVQRYMYFFLFYFFLHQLKPDPYFLMRLFVYFGLTYAGLYFLQFMVHPFSIVQSKAFYDRGTLRIFFPGANFLFITFFLSIIQYFLTRNRIYIYFILIGFIIFILLGTRQVLFTVILVTLMYILLSNKVQNKIAVFTLILLSAVAFFFIFQEIFLSMLEVSKKQNANIEGDVRYRAITFFLFDFFPNRISYITGNGVASANSAYGVMVNNLKLYRGFYQTDIGLIGDFSKFGLVFLIAQFSIMFRILFLKIEEKLVFIKLVFWSMAITLITGGSIAAGDSITSVCSMLYLVDAFKRQDKLTAPTGNIQSGKTTSYIVKV